MSRPLIASLLTAASLLSMSACSAQPDQTVAEACQRMEENLHQLDQSKTVPVTDVGQKEVEAMRPLLNGITNAEVKEALGTYLDLMGDIADNDAMTDDHEYQYLVISRTLQDLCSSDES